MNASAPQTAARSRLSRVAALAFVGAFALAAAGCGGGGVVVDDFYGDVELQNFAGPDIFVDSFVMFPFSGGSTGNLLFDPLPDNTVETVATLIEDTYDADGIVYDAFFDEFEAFPFPTEDVIGGFVTVYTVD